jgi:hypothetical protein
MLDFFDNILLDEFTFEPGEEKVFDVLRHRQFL